MQKVPNVNHNLNESDDILAKKETTYLEMCKREANLR